MFIFTKQAAAVVFGAVIALPAFALGRHDEKPHGMMKQPQQVGDRARPATGGRHDEGMTTHGAGRSAKEKPSVSPGTDARRDR